MKQAANRNPPPSAGHARTRTTLLGSGLVVMSSAAIAIVPSLAKLAYQSGSDPLTVIGVRSIFTAAVLLLLVVALHRSLRIPKAAIVLSLAVGPLYAAMLYGLLGAVAYIPVNVAIVIYYLHPLLVGLISVVRRDEPLTRLRLAALLAALVGIALIVGFSAEGLNVTGLMLALMAALTCAVLMVGTAAAMRQADSLVVTLLAMTSTAAILCGFMLWVGRLAFPATPLGWSSFFGVAAAYTVGTVTFFLALPMLGAVRAAMISNVEPVLGVCFAIIFVGERISLLQGCGIVLVLASILVTELRLWERSEAGPST